MTDFVSNNSMVKIENSKSKTLYKKNKKEITENIKLKQKEIDKKTQNMPKEIGGRSKEKGLEPVRYGDWEFKGRCIDF